MRRETGYKPCCFRTVDEATGKEKIVAPNVICSLNCEKCGFNPSAQRRRYEEGQFRPAEKRMNLMNGEYERLPKGTVQLVFPR